jgi:hypothetical protein
MNPLKVKATGSPITSANISGLQTMTDAEVKNYIANVITEKFAAVTDGTGTAEINITTNNSGAGTSIGTFVDTTRTESIGTHPATGAVSTTTYTAKQVTAAAAESITNRPLAWDSRLEEMVDGDIDSTMDLCIAAMVEESAYTAGQYKLQATAPSGGTWVSRYTLTDTAQGGNTVTYLWQKTVSSSLPTADLTPLRVFNGGNCKQMTEAEIEQMLPVFRNRIIETGIGTYKIQSDAPSGGTWVQTGNTFSDTREEVTPQNYAGNYSGNFTGNYSGTYGGVANYSGSRTYSSTYASNFSGNYVGNYTGSYGGAVNYSGSRNYSGNYVSYSTTNYSGAYSQNFTGTYSSNYTGFFSGSRNYAGNYVGFFSGTYSGAGSTQFFSGSRNYAGNYVGNYAGSYSESVPWNIYVGYYTGNTPGSYTGYFLGNAAPGPSYIGYFEAPTYTGTYSGLIGYAGTPYTIYQPTPNSLDTVVFFETPYFSGPGGFYSGPGYQLQVPDGGDSSSPAEYAGPSYSTPGGPTNYAGFFSGPQTYAGYYTGPGVPGPSYSGNYQGTYSGSRNYAGNYAGFFSGGNFVGNYAGSFSGSRTYSGNYAGNFSGNFVGNYAGFFSGNYIGPLTQFFSGSRTYSGNYLGGGSFSGNYSGSYINNFTGTYSGATIQATKETVSSVKLWIRTA